MQQDKWTKENSNPIEDIIKFIKNQKTCYPDTIICDDKMKQIIKDVYNIDLNNL